MQRKLIALVVAGLLLIASVVALAAPSVEQSKKLEAARAKMIEAQKEMINAQAAAGLITEEQAQALIKRLDEQAAQRQPLTEEQQKELAAAFAKQVAARKELIEAQVEAGLLSKEQGEQMIKQIEALAAYQEKIGFENYRGSLGFGAHMGRDCGMGRGVGRGMMGGFQGRAMRRGPSGMMNGQGGMMQRMMGQGQWKGGSL